MKNLTKSRASTNLHVQVDDIASIMINADLAIGSGVEYMGKNVFGNTIFNNHFADNHKNILQDLVQHGFINYLGILLK